MAQAMLTSSDNNQFALSGNLNFDTVSDLLKQGESRFSSVASIQIDLSAVTHVDSAGLALLLEWLRYGKHHNKPVRYQNLPEQLRSLAAISEVETLLQG